MAVQPEVYVGEQDPVRILNFVADRTGHAILAGDFDTFFTHVHLPHTIDTFDQRMCIDTKGGFRSLFYAIHHQYRRLGLTALLRTDVTASFGEETDEIVASFETRFMRCDVQAADPAPGLVVLRKQGQIWQTIRQSHANSGIALLSRPAGMTPGIDD